MDRRREGGREGRREEGRREGGKEGRREGRKEGRRVKRGMEEREGKGREGSLEETVNFFCIFL
jgi:hypothetical protein